MGPPLEAAQRWHVQSAKADTAFQGASFNRLNLAQPPPASSCPFEVRSRAALMRKAISDADIAFLMRAAREPPGEARKDRDEAGGG